MLSFFRFIRFPLSGCPKHKGFFNPFSLKKDFHSFSWCHLTKKLAETNKFPESGNKTPVVYLYLLVDSSSLKKLQFCNSASCSFFDSIVSQEFIIL